ncbi:MAG: helix-turn-helix domain-containing protein [Chloroflexota bacterium]|nr:helix-turn-helix domain-containing protein [Chloroflexota bacterium]
MAEKPFGARVQERRMQEGLSQEELAYKAGISRNYLSQIERGQATNLSWQVMERLATALGLSLEGSTASKIVWEELPSGLADFAQEAKLPEADVLMLAGLQYRGQRPTTPQQWKLIYNTIKAVVEP